MSQLYIYNFLLIKITLDMERREYTPVKGSGVLANLTNTQPTSTKTNIDYSSKASNQYDSTFLRQYETLKLQIKQLELQNRQLSTEAEKLKYEKNIQDNKYLQKITLEEDTIAQFQKQTKYQLDLVKIKHDQDLNRVRREFDYKLDQYQRELKSKDYHNREFNEKNSYLELRGNELKKGVETLEIELMKCRQNNAKISEFLTKEQFTKKKLLTITEQLQREKNQMQNEIHVLLDIQTQKSRSINSLQIHLRNSQSNERSLHQKLTVLTQNFANLQHHISIMKERLLSSELRNQQQQKQLQQNQMVLNGKENYSYEQKQRENQLRRELQVEQKRQQKRQKQLNELLYENQRLYKEIDINKQHLHQLCIIQGIDI